MNNVWVSNDSTLYSERLIKLLFLLFPVVFVTAPLIGGAAEKIILVVRMILLPLVLLWLLRRAIHWETLILFALLLVGTSYKGITQHSDDFLLVFVALAGTIILFRGGFLTAWEVHSDSVWESLAYGVTLVNIATVILLTMIVSGVLDVEIIFSLLQKDVELGFARFAIGNAIEIPFVMCALLYAAIRNSTRKSFLLITLLNTVVAVISQSRIIVIVTILIFFRQWSHSERRMKIVSAILLLASIIAFSELIFPTIDSLLSRFGGSDYGSGDDRAYLMNLVFQKVTVGGILFGNGLTSGASLLQEVTGTYRTLESVFLQILYEVGIVGMGLFILTMFSGLFKRGMKSAWLDPIIILLWIQMLFFLPINPMLPVAAFGLGASMFRSPNSRCVRHEL